MFWMSERNSSEAFVRMLFTASLIVLSALTSSSSAISRLYAVSESISTDISVYLTVMLPIETERPLLISTPLISETAVSV